MEDSRLSPYAWDLLVNQLFGATNSWPIPPDKLFLWNAKGVYIDYHYRNPTIRHYMGGEQLLGKRITAVLPQPMAKGVRSAVFQTLDMQQPLVEYYELPINNLIYRVQVRFLPFQDMVLGVVNDYPNLQEKSYHPLGTKKLHKKAKTKSVNHQ